MIITINYEFEDIMCDVYYDVDKTHRKPCCVDYSYDVDVCFEDIFEYTQPAGYLNWSKEKQKQYYETMEEQYFADSLDLEELENDEDFIQFLEDKYRSDARSECQKEND